MIIISKTETTNVSLTVVSASEPSGVSIEIDFGGGIVVPVAKPVSIQNVELDPQDFAGAETGFRKTAMVLVKRSDGITVRRIEIPYMVIEGQVQVFNQQIRVTVPIITKDPLEGSRAAIVKDVSMLVDKIVETVPSEVAFKTVTVEDADGNEHVFRPVVENGKVTSWTNDPDPAPLSAPRNGGSEATPVPAAPPAPETPAADGTEKAQPVEASASLQPALLGALQRQAENKPDDGGKDVGVAAKIKGLFRRKRGGKKK